VSKPNKSRMGLEQLGFFASVLVLVRVCCRHSGIGTGRCQNCFFRKCVRHLQSSK